MGYIYHCKNEEKNTEELTEEEIKEIKIEIKTEARDDWPSWASHFCLTCKNYSVPDKQTQGGEDNFAPVMSLSNPVESFITLVQSSLNCGVDSKFFTKVIGLDTMSSEIFLILDSLRT